MNSCYVAAREYLDLGLHPIPARGKVPIVPWKDYQLVPPLADEIDEWYAAHPDANVGLVVGRGHIVVDLDGDGAEGLLHHANIVLPRDAPRVRTGNGYHVHLAADHDVGDRIGLLTAPGGGKPQVDVRGIGFVVAPPSTHPSGRVYEWIVPFVRPLPKAPSALLRLLSTPQPKAPPLDDEGTAWIADTLRGVGEGLRDATCTRLAGYFIGRGVAPAVVELILEAAFAPGCSPPFPRADVRKCVRSIAQRHRLNGAPDRTAVAVPLAVALDQLETDMRHPHGDLVVTPFRRLNQFLSGGFHPGELVYLGARPGVGKTALGLVIARRCARSGRAVLVISREMLNVALARRIVAQESSVPAALLRSGRIVDDPEAATAVAATMRQLRDAPIWLSDDAVTLDEILSIVSEWPTDRVRLGLVIVDYLQLVRAPQEIRDRRLQIEHVSQALKTLALRASIPVLCLSSLARPAPGASGSVPTLASLRESGELEHDADIVLLLHRLPLEPATDCIVAKNRDGRVGIAALVFDDATVNFTEAP